LYEPIFLIKIFWEKSPTKTTPKKRMIDIKSENGATYLSDVAQISFKEKDISSFARSYGEKVILIHVKKRGGKNLIQASQKIQALIDDIGKNIFPKNIKLTISNDQSAVTLNQVSDLVNNIIFGVLLVVTVLMFFLGFRNSLFVGFAIPMSMFMSFMILSLLGYTMNTMVLFGLVMGLGMLVDNGIVVVENVYRFLILLVCSLLCMHLNTLQRMKPCFDTSRLGQAT